MTLQLFVKPNMNIDVRKARKGFIVKYEYTETGMLISFMSKFLQNELLWNQYKKPLLTIKIIFWEIQDTILTQWNRENRAVANTCSRHGGIWQSSTLLQVELRNNLLRLELLLT